MELMLLRHGVAEDRGPDDDDASRRLTDEGVEKVQRTIRGLRHVARQPNIILASPKVRALQTAEIAGALFARVPVILHELASSDVIDIIGALARRPERVVLVVGHEPTLSQTAEVLCTLSRSMCFIELKKAGCICIDVDFADGAPARQAAIKWVATSKMLRSIVETSEPGESVICD